MEVIHKLSTPLAKGLWIIFSISTVKISRPVSAWRDRLLMLRESAKRIFYLGGLIQIGS